MCLLQKHGQAGASQSRRHGKGDSGGFSGKPQWLFLILHICSWVQVPSFPAKLIRSALSQPSGHELLKEALHLFPRGPKQVSVCTKQKAVWLDMSSLNDVDWYLQDWILRGKTQRRLSNSARDGQILNERTHEKEVFYLCKTLQTLHFNNIKPIISCHVFSNKHKHTSSYRRKLLMVLSG